MASDVNATLDRNAASGAQRVNSTELAAVALIEPIWPL